MSEGHAKAPRNRLRDSLSPYLLQHASNPVDWYPWGDEALERARKEDRPIFLSIGYAACHWCHVMERESFENEGVAKYMNEHFVNIKVDREERPDIDEIYMSATLAISGSGGWPMSVFLTPDLRPFFAGTYFPPDARYGRPGFPQLLERIVELWKTSREGLVAQADELTKAVKRITSMDSAPGMLSQDLTVHAARALVHHFDPDMGGFGGAPKFPNSAGILALLREHRRSGDQKALHAALFTLRKMAEGGIYDHLGGGFHRYSTDDEWLVPHFEKMLYDQAQLVRAYLAAWKIEKYSPLWQGVVRETIGYVLRELRSPEGGLYSTQDADSEGEEGKFFVWSPAEVREVIGEAANELNAVYDVTEHGNFEGKSILHPVVPVDDETRERFAPLMKKLWEAREKRVKPGLDDKVLADWNGLMLHALAEAGSALQEPAWIDAARACARFWKERMRGPRGELYRVWRRGQRHTEALQVDYAALALGLVALYQATFELEWLELAQDLVKRMNELFWDAEAGGWFATEATRKDLIARAKSPQDGATPSGNSLGVAACLALHRLTGDEDLRARAEKTMRLYRELMEKSPSAVLVMVGALQEHLEGPPEVALVAKKDDPELAKMLEAVRSRFLPGVALAWKAPGASAGAVKLLEGKEAKDGAATAHVCRSFACELPVTSAQELANRLDAPPPKN